MNDVAGLDAKGAAPEPAVADPSETMPSMTQAIAGPVACVAGRGPFDDAASTMVCQLLTRNGVAARVVAHDDVSRERVSRLDLLDVKVVVLSYLDLSGPTSPLRYLGRRLRQHAPGLRIIVGFWPAGDQPDNAARRQAVGADGYVGSLREVLELVHSSRLEQAPASDPRPLLTRTRP